MNWPLASDYQDTIQNPAMCFHDPQLKAGQPVLNKLGLPRVASGAFASVYEVRSAPPNMTQRWAVRCFLRPSADQQNRYNLLSQYLGRLTMPGLVGFAYQPQGIRVKGAWYPIVKMDWVVGETLHTYIGKHVKEAATLCSLAAQWRLLLDHLRQNHIAHADLQHGNVMVTPDGELRLVDYDGMFVPSLRGQPSHELGHPNYQHPQRTANDYDEHLDNFAALVIYTSLVALIYHPDLWAQFHTGENLIFSASDFKAPQKSAVFERLYRSPEAIVAQLSRRLALACEGSIARVPDFALIAAEYPEIPMPQPWWQIAPGAEPPRSRQSQSQTQTFAAPAAPTPLPSAPASHRAMTGKTSAPSHDAPLAPATGQEAPEWWETPRDRNAPQTKSQALFSGVIQPLAKLWKETAPLPAESSSAPDPHLPAPAEAITPGIPRSRSRRKGPGALTCSSVTFLIACLALYGTLALAQAVWQRAKPHRAPSHAAARTVRRSAPHSPARSARSR